jgi:hypothetical protein
MSVTLTRRAASIAIAVALAIASAEASAAPLGVSDPDDVRGPLDISRVDLDRPTTSSPLGIDVSFYRRVTRRLFVKGGRVRISFDTGGGLRPEWIGAVRPGRDGLTLVVSSRRRELARYRIRRPNNRTLATTIPGSTEANPNGPLRVRVASSWRARHGPCKRACNDRAPDAGSVVVSV